MQVHVVVITRGAVGVGGKVDRGGYTYRWWTAHDLKDPPRGRDMAAGCDLGRDARYGVSSVDVNRPAPPSPRGEALAYAKALH